MRSDSRRRSSHDRLAALSLATCRATVLFLVLAAIAVPGLLWAYQIAQFGDWGWDLTRMRPERVVATIAKGLEASFVATLLNVLGRKFGWFNATRAGN